MDIKALREMDDVKLSETLTEKRAELFSMRFKHATAQQENTQQIPVVKRTIARILTLQRERQMGAK